MFRIKRGFTLVEVAITIALIGFLAITIAAVLNVGDNTWRTEMILLGLQQRVRLAVDGMAREIRVGEDCSKLAITADTAELDSVIFSIPSSAQDIEYSVNANDELIREHPVGTTKILAMNITELDFDCPAGTDMATISLTAQTTEGKWPLSFSLKEQVWLRNEP